MNKKYVVAILCSTVISTSVNAQQRPVVIEEIIVTAQKREQAVTDVPIAIDVLTGDGLRERGAASLIDIAQYSPGVNIRGPFGDFSYPLISIRGVNTDGFVETISQSTGVYTDGVFVSSPPMLALRILDLERMEILKGPQGTLYGRNTIGGAINFISKQPTFENEGYLTAGYGRYDRFNFEGAYGGALSDKVAARAAVKYVRQTDSPLTNTFAGDDDGGEIDQLYGRVALLYEPHDDFSARVELHTGRDHSDSWPFALIPAGVDTDGDGVLDRICDDFANGNVPAAQVNCFAADPFGTGTEYNNADGDPYTNALDQDGQQNTEAFGGSLELSWDLGRFGLTSLTAWDDFERRDETDADAGPLGVLGTIRNSDVSQVSQELRFSASPESRVQWIGGLYYSSDELEGDPSFTNAAGRSDFNSLDTKTFGVFGQFEYPLSDDVNLTLGGRWTQVDRDAFYMTTAAGAFGNAGVTNDFSDGDYSFKAALDYSVSDKTMLYASLSRGFNAGTFNTQFVNNASAFEPTNSESILAYEVGMKTSTDSGRANMEFAAFYYDYDDIQLVAVEPADVIAANRLINASGAMLYGFEAQFRAVPTDWLDISLGVAFIESEIGEATTQVSGTGTASPYPFNAPVFGSTTFDLNGTQLPNHPNWSINGSVRAQRQVRDNWDGFVQFDFLWEDEIPRDLLSTAALFTESHWNLDAQIGVRSQDEMWSINLWGRNLTDEVYLTEAYEVSGFGFYIAAGNYSYPRTYGINLTRNF